MTLRYLLLVSLLISSCVYLPSFVHAASDFAEAATPTLTSASSASVTTSSVPVRLEWSTQLEVAAADLTLRLTPFIASSLPVFTARLPGFGDGESTLVGISLADGRPLWNTTGVQTSSEDGVNYTLPYIGAEWLGSDALVADYWLDLPLEEWRGFALLHPKTGEVMMKQDVDPFKDSPTAALTKMGYLYIAQWGLDHRKVLRLAGPSFGLDKPAAKLTFSGSNMRFSSSGLYTAQRTGHLAHVYVETSENHQSLTLQGLHPTTLDPIWKVTELDASSQITMDLPVEDLMIVANSTSGSPSITELAGYSLVNGQLRFRWRVDWKSAPSRVAFFFQGVAWDRTLGGTGSTRMCTMQTAWFTPNALGAHIWFTCIDPTTYKTTLNITLKAPGQPAAYGTFLAIYEKWTLIKDERTGSIMAFDCFTDLSTPSWTIRDQSDLASVSVSDDGHSFFMTVAQSGRISKWIRQR